MQSDNSQKQAGDSVWILILGAGYSRRMGKPKQLLPISEEPMIRYVARKSLTVSAGGVAVVVNEESPSVTEELRGLPIHILLNPDSVHGMSSSLHVGIRFLQERQVAAVVILLADQPDIDPRMIKEIILQYRSTSASIIQARYRGIPGHPVLFARQMFGELLKIEGDQGARGILRKYAEQILRVQTDAPIPMDIDTPEDYQLYISQQE